MTYVAYSVFSLNSTALRRALSFQIRVQAFVMQSLEIGKIGLEVGGERRGMNKGNKCMSGYWGQFGGFGG